MGISEIIGIVDHYFRPLIIVLSTAITILLSSKKIGNKVTVHYKIVSDIISAQRIDDIVLVNHKDKPVPIFRIYALLENENILEVEVCDPPIVIEPYGAVSIKTKPHSKLYKKNDVYEPDYTKSTIVLESVGKLITCKLNNRNLKNLFKYKMIAKSTTSYNGVVHDGRDPYAILYVQNSMQKLSFITKAGFFHHEWDFIFNGIDMRDGKVLNEHVINEFLEQNGYADIMSNYLILKLKNGNYSPVLNKK
ncbi:TPA: hypothetical protein ACIFB5_000470 [Acinetobacter baumannii]